MNRFACISFAFLSLTAIAGAAQAEELSLNIGPDSLRAFFAGPMSRALAGTSGQYDLGAIYKKGDGGSSDARDSRLTLLHAGLLATGDPGLKGVQTGAGLGARVVFVQRRQHGFDLDGGAVALGGQFEVRLPGYERVGLTGYGWLAPSITSFSGVSHYNEYALDLEFEVVRAAALYAGYRSVHVKADAGGPSDADSDGHIGIRLRF